MQQLRKTVRAKLSQALSGCLPPGSTVNPVSVQPSEIEAALFDLYDARGDDNPRYKAKARELWQNLGDAQNSQLRQSILQGLIAAVQLVRMTPDQVQCCFVSGYCITLYQFANGR